MEEAFSLESVRKGLRLPVLAQGEKPGGTGAILLLAKGYGPFWGIL